VKQKVEGSEEVWEMWIEVGEAGGEEEGEVSGGMPNEWLRTAKGVWMKKKKKEKKKKHKQKLSG
jgi:hypothetical protein